MCPDNNWKMTKFTLDLLSFEAQNTYRKKFHGQNSAQPRVPHAASVSGITPFSASENNLEATKLPLRGCEPCAAGPRRGRASLCPAPPLGLTGKRGIGRCRAARLCFAPSGGAGGMPGDTLSVLQRQERLPSLPRLQNCELSNLHRSWCFQTTTLLLITVNPSLVFYSLVNHFYTKSHFKLTL